jgi:hypothetical protein
MATTVVGLHQRDALPTRTVVAMTGAWVVAAGVVTEGLSLASYLLLLSVVATWFVYGVLEANPVVWLPNAIAILVVGMVVVILARSEPDTGVRLAPVAD